MDVVDEQQIDNAANNVSSINGGGVGSDAESHPNDNVNGDNNEDNNGDDSDNNSVESIASIDSNGVRVKFYDPWEFDEEVVDHLHNNDPSCDSIWIWSSHMNPLDIDWGKEGSAMSENTRLKSLDMHQFESEVKSDRERRYAERNARSFYRAIAACSSLKYLSMEGCIVRGLLCMGEIFTLLIPSLRNNLCSLIVSDITLDSQTVEAFKNALSGCNLNLRCIGLNHCDGMNSGVMKTIVEVLAANPSITELHLDKYDMDKDVVVILGNALCTNISLKRLYMDGCREPPTPIGSVAEGGMEYLASCLSRSNSLMEEVHLHKNHITVEGGLYLLAELIENRSLKVLDIYGAVSPHHADLIMSSTGWDMFFDFLGQSCSPLHTLNLGGNTIGDEQITSLVDSLIAMGSLKDLNLRDTDISSSGWVKFFNLRRPGTVLETLEKLNMMSWANENLLNDEGMIAFTTSLHGNTSFKTLDSMGFNVTEEGGWAALSTALCDKSSIQGVCNSNHTFSGGVSFGWYGEDPNEVTTLLNLNKAENKHEVIRQKLFRYYFSENKNLHEIANINDEVLPRLLGAIAKDAKGIQMMYKIVKIVPSLFDTKQYKTLSGKRKR